MTFLPSLLHTDMARERTRHGDRVSGRRLVRPGRPAMEPPRRER